MKKLTVLMAILFASVVVFGQNTATIDQSGGDANTAYTEQLGDGDFIYIKQVVSNPTGPNTAGVDASDHILQNGNNNIIRLKQEVTIQDLSRNQANMAKIVQIGNNQKLVGATSAGQLGSSSSLAIQTAERDGNALNIKQWGGSTNEIGLYQSAKWGTHFGTTSAAIEQKGWYNDLVVYQHTSAASSTVASSSQQIGNYNVARLKQTAGGGEQSFTLNQTGNYNYLVGANSDGSIDLTDAAMQLTGSEWGGRTNNLDVNQTGGDNRAGLYQSSTGFKTMDKNTADIDQIGGGNRLGAYQVTYNLSADLMNELFVDQDGGDVATVLQTGAGNNYANIIQ